MVVPRGVEPRHPALHTGALPLELQNHGADTESRTRTTALQEQHPTARVLPAWTRWRELNSLHLVGGQGCCRNTSTGWSVRAGSNRRLHHGEVRCCHYTTDTWRPRRESHPHMLLCRQPVFLLTHWVIVELAPLDSNQPLSRLTAECARQEC
jgi:hypothetical protein